MARPVKRLTPEPKPHWCPHDSWSSRSQGVPIAPVGAGLRVPEFPIAVSIGAVQGTVADYRGVRRTPLKLPVF
jgi:hypothetical protein